MKLQDLTIREFLQKVATNGALPGGGSSSALVAAIATSLAEMMANLTVGKRHYADVEERMEEIAAEMAGSREIFLNSIDRDAESYSLALDALRLPGNSDEERVFRDEQIEEAMKQAALISMEIAERAYSLLDTMIETLHEGNRNSAADGLVGIIFCRSAIIGSLMNARANTSAINDTPFVEEISMKCDQIEKSTIEKEQNAINWVKPAI